MTNCNWIDDYIKFVRNDKYPVCPYVYQLIDLVEKIFKEETLYWFDDQIEKYFSYEKYFPFKLFEWEKFIFVLHNCIYTEDYELRFPEIFIFVGRGTGKNGYESFEDFCLLTPTNYYVVNGKNVGMIKNYDIDICANSEDQAKTSFKEVYNILESNKDKMKKHFKWTLTEITNLKTQSVLRYRTSNAQTKDGLRTGKVGFDEVHAYENWDKINVFKTGLGKVEYSRITNISTNGDIREGVIDSLLEKSKSILNGDMPDNGFLPMLCCLMEESQVENENNWHMANPSLRYRKSLLHQMRREYQDYKLDPNKNISFMTKRMNLYKEREDELVATWENIVATNKVPIYKDKQACIFGIDFTKTSDFLGTFMLFKNDIDTYSGKQFSWWCKQSADRGYVDIPFDEWEKAGHLKQIDAPEISKDLLLSYLEMNMWKYNIIKLCIDSYRFSFISSELMGLGFTLENKNLKLVRPSDLMLVQTKIDSVFRTQKLKVGDDPLFRWYTNNTKLSPAPNNNFKYEKIYPKKRKTDGFMAFANTMTCERELPVYRPTVIKPILL